MPVQSQISKLLTTGYSVAKSDGGWLASYQNSAGKLHEIGIFADQKKAERACILWSQGYRFAEMRAEYEAGKTLVVLAEKYKCCAHWVRECIVLAGGTMRKVSPTNRKHKPESLEAMRERMRQTRLMRHRRIDAFEGERYDL